MFQQCKKCFTNKSAIILPVLEHRRTEHPHSWICYLSACCWIRTSDLFRVKEAVYRWHKQASRLVTNRRYQEPPYCQVTPQMKTIQTFPYRWAALLATLWLAIVCETNVKDSRLQQLNVCRTTSRKSFLRVREGTRTPTPSQAYRPQRYVSTKFHHPDLQYPEGYWVPISKTISTPRSLAFCAGILMRIFYARRIFLAPNPCQKVRPKYPSNKVAPAWHWLCHPWNRTTVPCARGISLTPSPYH